jgi:hypothetical protein
MCTTTTTCQADVETQVGTQSVTACQPSGSVQTPFPLRADFLLCLLISERQVRYLGSEFHQGATDPVLFHLKSNPMSMLRIHPQISSHLIRQMQCVLNVQWQ